MKIAFILLLISSLTYLGFSNYNKALEFWTKQETFDKAIDFEKSLNRRAKRISMNVSLSESVYPLINKYKIAQPIIIERKKAGFLPMYAEYFYSEGDSVLRYISYDWQRDKYGNLFKKQAIWKEESKKLKEYNAEYEIIKAALASKLGKPKSQDSEPQTVKSTAGRGDYLSRKTVWETEEYYSVLTMIFESMTYRIRWNYYWKN